MVPLPTLDALDGLAIPAACPVPWDSMRGGARTRFCDQCSQNVHDVSELTRAEALRLVAPGREVPCLRIYRRQDGRVMTVDCATKRERVWKWLHGRSPWVAAAFGLVIFAGCSPVCTTGEALPVDQPPSAQALQSVVGAAAVVAAKPGAPGDR